MRSCFGVTNGALRRRAAWVGVVSFRSNRSQCAIDSDAIPCEHCGDEFHGHGRGGSHDLLLSGLRPGVLWRGRSWQSTVTA
jgi:hypothetical protein